MDWRVDQARSWRAGCAVATRRADGLLLCRWLALLAVSLYGTRCPLCEAQQLRTARGHGQYQLERLPAVAPEDESTPVAPIVSPVPPLPATPEPVVAPPSDTSYPASPFRPAYYSPHKQGVDYGPVPSSPPTAPSNPPQYIGPLMGATGPMDDFFALRARYKYNFGGGYLNIATPRDTISINLQNEITFDGTFFDLPGMPTAEKGFNIPFLRTYLFGNVTPNWQYQIATQSFLGQFNILDAFINYHASDSFNIRAGRGLSPFLYEYYAFSPAWEPVITNSMLFQLAGKRQEGVMFWGNAPGRKFQYQLGVFNGVSGAFYDLDRNVDFIGSIAITPFAGDINLFDSLGIGAGVQTGQHNYALNQTSTSFTNGAGEPTTNINYITSSGISWFQYDVNTYAAGMQTKVAPQIFWFNRLSVLAEYLYCTRTLSLNGIDGVTIQRGWYINGSYFLTGERYSGNGLGGYTTVSPLRPWRPRRGISGPGAWELAAQFSQLELDAANFNFTSNPGDYASRADQLMIGINWWPNRYTRLSLDNVFTWFDNAIPLGPNPSVSQFNTVWCRAAMFF